MVWLMAGWGGAVAAALIRRFSWDLENEVVVWEFFHLRRIYMLISGSRRSSPTISQGCQRFSDFLAI